MASDTRTLLIVHASPNVAVGKYSSITRSLGTRFETQWKQAHPDQQWITVCRDLESTPPHIIDRHWAIQDKNSAASFTYSDEVIAEFQAADAVVIATPVHNFTASALLKMYTDSLTRLGSTHIPACCTDTFDDPTHPWEGGLDDGTKPVFLLVSSMWDYSEGSPLAPRDHLVPWFKDAMDLVGVTNVYVIRNSNALFYFGQKDKSSLMEVADGRIASAIEECKKSKPSPRIKRVSPCGKCAAKACPCGWPACSGCMESNSSTSAGSEPSPKKVRID